MIRPNSNNRTAMSNQSTNPNYLEAENDSMVNDLRTKASALKQITVQIGDEVRNQNYLLSQMGDDFEGSHGLLSATMRRLGLVSKSGGHKFLCYLIAFSFFVFIMIWYLVR